MARVWEICLLSKAPWVFSDDVLVAIDDDGLGEGRIVVTGSGSSLVATDEFQVGYTGVGVLLVESGGMASSAFGTIGAYPGSSGIAQVVDIGSLWSNSGTLYVGGDDFGAGGSGILNVSTGGVVSTGDLMIWSSGQLEGNGRVEATQVINDGVLVPDGTLTLDAELIHGQTGTVDVRIDDSGASDRVQVTGPVTIEGGTVVAAATETITQTWDYTILTGSSVVGSFDTLDRSQVAILLTDPGISDLRLAYDAGSVFLQVVSLPFNDASITQTPNQRAIGQVLQGMSQRGGNRITTALGQLNGMKAVRSAYDQLSGQTRLALPSVSRAITDGFESSLYQRLQEQTEPEPESRVASVRAWGASPSPPLGESGSRAWGQAYGMGGRRAADDVTGYHWHGLGSDLGVDHWLTDHLLLGLAVGGTFSRIRHDGSGDRTDVESLHTGLYSRWNLGRIRLDGLIHYSDLDYKSRRSISLTGEQADARFGGRSWGASLEGAWLWWEAMGWDLEPLVGLQQTEVQIDSTRESGGSTALRYGAQDWRSLRGWLGLRASSSLGYVGAGPVCVQCYGRWAHVFSDGPPAVSASFVQDSQASFTLTDSKIGRDSLLLGLGVQLKMNQQTQATFKYQGLLNPDETRHVLSGGIVYRW